ncbi:hypothetical protein V8J88_22695 [Massilia sp. W12]|uniref:hypothetical protein n=1 Tax=Massilia sp. W12 TaxID=3126507 RepID=UPI0030CE18F9
MAKDLRQTIEAGLNIGLSASANTRLRSAMQEAMQQMNGIRFVAILDENTGLLYEGKIDPGLERSWRTHLQHNDNLWQQSHPEYLEMGMSFSNNFNLRIGAVMIGYERAPIEQAMAEMRRKLLLDTLQTLALAALLITVGVYLLTRKLQRDLHTVAGHLDAIVDSQQAPQLPPGVFEREAAEEIDQFANLSHRMLHNMRQAEEKPAK